MDNANDILTQLEQLRSMFHDVSGANRDMSERYAWVIVKALYSKEMEQDSVRSRQYLAEAMRLDLPRPSKVYSALLGVACRMAHRFVDFHFAAFLKLWDLRNLQPDDYRQSHTDDGRLFLSLAERVVKAYMHALLLRPSEVLPREQIDLLFPVAKQMNYYSPRPMIVSSLTKTEVNGRAVRFARLTDAEGLEVSCEIHALQANPLHSAPVSRHFVEVGQVYDVLPRERQHFSDELPSEGLVRVVEAYLSSAGAGSSYPLCVGYVEAWDAKHRFYHVYDSQSRHFVVDASSQMLGRGGRPVVTVGGFIVFAPVVPRPSVPLRPVFKRAIVVRALSQAEGLAGFGVREARVLAVDAEKGYFRWTLSDPQQPIVEQGTKSPVFTEGYVSFAPDSPTKLLLPDVPSVGTEIRLAVYLKRGRDKQKRPRVAFVM